MVSNSMEEIIQIKCPFDGAVLSVKNQPGIESKNVTCPICKHKYPFTQFRRIDKSVGFEEEGTEYSYPEKEHHHYANEGDSGKAAGAEGLNLTLGTVRILSTGQRFLLRPGRNVIGRRSMNSTADIQINTGDQRVMSREHIVIEVKKMPSKGFVHYVSLFKPKVNKTFVGSDPLFYGDCIVLNHGDRIILPNENLIFEIPDEEGTTY